MTIHASGSQRRFHDLATILLMTGDTALRLPVMKTGELPFIFRPSDPAISSQANDK
ncbi:MAG: hypothetical protein HYX62_04560 [Gammaproteobacteria bacterium]|nr:hypothetical protein [Gammaproteobacteria bacterium]